MYNVVLPDIKTFSRQWWISTKQSRKMNINLMIQMFILHVWWRNVGYLTYTKVWLTVSLLKHLEYIWHSDLIISSYNTCIQPDYYLYSANEIMFIFLAQVWNNFYIKPSRLYKDIYNPCEKILGSINTKIMHTYFTSLEILF